MSTIGILIFSYLGLGVLFCILHSIVLHFIFRQQVELDDKLHEEIVENVHTIEKRYGHFFMYLVMVFIWPVLVRATIKGWKEGGRENE